MAYKRHSTPQPATTEEIAEKAARDEARIAEESVKKLADDRNRTDCYRNDFKQSALNLGVLARELYSVARDADTIDTRRVIEELKRLDMLLARCVERIAEEGGLIAG